MEDFDATKKLLVGSLVFLICDKTLICATISSRDEETLRNGSIYIVPIAPFNEIPSSISTLLGIRKFHFFESCIYFEAYQHVLKSLNRMGKLPDGLEQYFVGSDNNMQPPDYLTNVDTSEVSVDLGCLYQQKNKMVKNKLLSSLDLYKHLNEDRVMKGLMTLDKFLNLSSIEKLRVNKSQLNSIKSVFNHRVSLTQGPPGTGKSYVGKLLLEVLLKNRHLWQTKPSPILLVCYTNRALDSFLEDMLSVTNKVIRIGGRSKSEVLEVHNLQSLKKGKTFHNF
jgi:hypothetical protein